ncbi:MerR family transcriptional regulator [Sulfitobacter aestuariivivens]|uniref:MerR family transcriptional regulator n=1 Tax=Sulfitobacter aestuariivivens TaxID=2766981 RepID=UPI00362423FE
MAKSPEAFRTISEVAEWLGIQAHVLRFWESKFSQVKPIKRAGGRRYYRPTDMLLLGGIKRLLHDDGLTIKGVQKILREEGMSHVADLSQPLDDLTISQLDDAPAPTPEPEPVAEEKGVVLSFETPAEDAPAPVMDAGTDLFGDAPEPVAPPQDSAPAPVDEMMEDAPAAATEELPEAVDPEPAPIEAADAEPEPMTEALVADDIAPASDDATEAVTPTADELAPSEQPVPSSALPAFCAAPWMSPRSRQIRHRIWTTAQAPLSPSQSQTPLRPQNRATSACRRCSPRRKLKQTPASCPASTACAMSAAARPLQWPRCWIV